MIYPALACFIIYISALLAMAFFTLLERKVLGYIQSRKGPNKVAIMGLPQPMADALKLFLKEQSLPSLANMSTFMMAPALSLFLALTMWMLYPSTTSSFFITMGALLFLCISSLNVYTTLGAGWSSNSKYALLGALRSVAQTISYEVSMVLILLSPLVIFHSLTLTSMSYLLACPPLILFPLLFMCWFTTTLAETNRTPFDFAEGESELVSGFNTEYSSGAFALIFMAEYMNIIIISMLTVVFFIPTSMFMFMENQLQVSLTTSISFLFLWIRGTLPRMRYDHLMYLTWKTFLLFSIMMLLINIPLTSIL
uniref:NADH-ubiquinone oxidoreductase chain 1 n=1 Tax=Marphysa tamurai TaxID=2094016 RepID=A0A343UQZ2_9ANNE|nr:NADH dehydrogenase subunit 1 [Marphysa tamurai]AVG72594.1 NADH dehydrogenase subunit 1 [Marphysa tamurai]